MLTYFITCHSSLQYMSELLSVIYNKTDLFIVHVDVKAPIELKSALLRFSKANPENVALLPSRPYSWAGWSQVETVLDAIELALLSPRWTHFVPLSEQHLPTMGVSSIRALFQGQLHSFVPARPVSEMGPEEKSDIINRFSIHYRELAGVGSFYDGISSTTPAFVDLLYHGSNWFALSGKHCEEIQALRQRRYFDIFSRALHQDENAIQTAIWQTLKQADADSVKNQNTTFIAWPHLTDNPDMVMCDDNLRSAIADNVPFIRKRSLKLTEFVRKHLTDIKECESVDLRPVVGKIDHPEALRQSQIKSRIVNSAKSMDVSDYSNISPSPSLHISINVAENVSVHVVSSNYINFKVAIVHYRTYDGFREPSREKGFELSLLRVRAHGMFFYEEVVASDRISNGFFVLEHKADEKKLIEGITNTIEQAKRFATTRRE